MKRRAAIAFFVVLFCLFIVPMIPIFKHAEPSLPSIEEQLRGKGYAQDASGGWRVTGVLIEVDNGAISRITYSSLFIICVPEEADKRNLEAAVAETEREAKAIAFQQRTSGRCYPA